LLEEWWKLSMIEGLKSIGKNLDLPAFELVYWADAVYDKPLLADITDENDPYFLDEPYTPSVNTTKTKTQAFRLKVTGFIAKQLKRFFLNKDLSLKNRTIAESIVQKYFHEFHTYYKESSGDENDLHSKARAIMIDRVVTALRKYQHDDIFLIGHSMGSILAFDALSFKVTYVPVNTFISVGSPLGMPLVISNIAARQKLTRYGRAVIKTPSSIQKAWYNFSDLEDIISINCRLGDEFIPNDTGVKPIDILVRNDYSLNGRHNPHNIFGYLRTKEFATVLAAFIEEEKPGLLRKMVDFFRALFKRKSHQA